MLQTLLSLLLALPVLSVVLLATPVPAAAGTVILHPVSGSLVDEEGGLVVGFCDEPGKTEVAMYLNGKEHRVPLWDGVLYLDLDWTEGENELKVEQQTIRFTSDPYAEKLREPAVHEAMLDNCANCHVLGPDLDLSLVGEAAALCRGCHGEVAAAVMHGEGECVGCHAPHTSWNPKLLLRTDNRLCEQCHASLTGQKGMAHDDVWDELACTTCHPGHRPEPSDVGGRCARCHRGYVDAQPSHREVVDTGCQICHAMHGQGGKGLWKDPAESCRSCHPVMVDADHEGTVTDCGDCHGVHEAREPTPNGERCGACHRELMEKERLHGPEAVGRCDPCHPVHDPRNRSASLFSCTGCHGMANLQTAHTGSVVGFDTCVQCHRLHESNEAFFIPPIQHTPFAEHSCSDCHDDPGFDVTRKYPKAWVELCGGCHDSFGEKGKRHGPVDAGRCQDCHVPHASPWRAQLRDEPRVLCLSCHAELRKQVGAGSPHYEQLLCFDCHDPHAGANRHYLKAEGNALCTECHPDPILDLGGVLMPYVHGPLNTVGCTFCHDSHGGRGGPHLRMPVKELCLGCHEEFDPAAHTGRGGSAHKPVAEGRCGDCHRSHAARNKSMLHQVGNTLCQRCHDPERHSHTLVPQTKSSFATVPEDWPRVGDQLACRSCHLPHYAGEKRLFVQPRTELCERCHAGI